MTIQSEAQLEDNLIKQLVEQGYDRVHIPDEAAMLQNLKTQLEVHNNASFSADEFKHILNHLDQGNVFKRAHILRDRYNLRRDNGSELSICFLNTQKWCKNQFQVTHQVTQDGIPKGGRVNRYDVTILINGLPLVHIELKRRGIEIDEAFNQVNRYRRESFASGYGLFQYVQIFVISNGVNTKYYANQHKQNKMQTFFWADEHNKHISCLSDFARSFLEKCHIAKMISRHIVLHSTNKILMVLRPYQVYAVEALVERVTNTRNNGYIWHTTGSGKTLTSFKAAKLIEEIDGIDKVLFVVDRVDLDYQTIQEFNNYQTDSVDSTSNTGELVMHLTDSTKKLVVTTIQKLNKAVSASRHAEQMAVFNDKRTVLIFDECHRSQFGMTHQRIIDHFKKAQFFGFTGTPIFAENAVSGHTDISGKSTRLRTTKDLFGECLHHYLIDDAIADKNVLGFSVDYYGLLKRRDSSLIDDEQVADINRKEWFESEDRISKICDWIVKNHDRKTHDRAFTSILAVGSIEAACTYYETLKQMKVDGAHKLNVVTIFSAPINEEDPDADGHLPADESDDITPPDEHSPARQRLDSYIGDYNAMFGTGYSAKEQGGFYNYYRNISRRIKSHDREDFNPNDRVDILLVVNMFLTGFDAKKLNTLYVDKNLRQHSLIQAFSRTNRIFNAQKSHGLIVCFRNLKPATDGAILLFSNKDSKTQILLDPYEDYVIQFNDETLELLKLASTPQNVDKLIDEKAQLEFVKIFRQMMRTMNTLRGFADFKWDDLTLKQQDYEDYKSKYLDLYDRAQQAHDENAVASILNDVDFELELIRRDEINVHYILQLLADAPRPDSNKNKSARAKVHKTVISLLESEVQLRSKRVLIEKFITEYWEGLDTKTDIIASFHDYWDAERRDRLEFICAEEQLEITKVETLLGQYRFTSREPLSDDIINVMKTPPKILERRDRINSASKKIMDVIEVFEDV